MSKIEQKFSNSDLKTMQSWDLEHKIAVSKTRIIEFYNAMYNKINILNTIYRLF